MAQSPENYEAIRGVVREVLMEHLEAIEDRIEDGGHTKSLTTTMTDVDGTLNNPHCGIELNQFLCDLIDAGLPVIIHTGGAPEREFPVFAKLRQQKDFDWFLPKPSDPKQAYKNGLYFEDDYFMGLIAAQLKVTVLNPGDRKTINFLKSWVQLTPADNAAALQPWVELDQRLRAPRAAFEWSHFGRP